MATLRKMGGKNVWIAQGFADVTGQGQLYDERRVRNFKNYFCTSFDKKEVLSHSNLAINQLSVTPDDCPLVGNLRHHPNIFVNAGHGQRSTGLAFVSAKAIADMIEGGQDSGEEAITAMHPKRFLV